MKKYFIFALLGALTLSQTAFAFSDIYPDYGPSYQAITWMEDNGIVVGYDDGEFKPDQDVNRVEFLKILYDGKAVGGEGYPNPTSMDVPFSDVDLDEWYGPYVYMAYEDGVVDGYPDGTFRPADPINYAEAIKIVVNGFFDVDEEYDVGGDYYFCADDLSADPGVNTQQWYWEYLYVAENKCMLDFPIGAWGAWGYFKLDANVSRGDMVEMVYRAKSVVENGVEKYTTYLSPDLCYDGPFSTAIGRGIYPVASEFSHLAFLGEIFTAEKYCGGLSRANEMFGVEDGMYTIGSSIYTHETPDSEFEAVLTSIGYICDGDEVPMSECKGFSQSDTVELDLILQLVDYADRIKSNSCINCG